MAQKKKKQPCLLVGNWKMNPQTFAEAKKLFSGIEKKASSVKRVSVVVAAPYLSIGRLKGTHVSLGGQDIFKEDAGAYTGCISGPMLADAGAKYVIVGHSERRKLGDTDAAVNAKAKAALRAGLIPIVCIGEETRSDDGQHLDFIRKEIKDTFAGFSKKDMQNMIIAYEPIWAVGAAVAMSPHDAHEMNLFIKKVIREEWKGIDADLVPILYGGSVDETNAAALVESSDMRGLLVGRQSLSAESFGGIMNALNDL